MTTALYTLRCFQMGITLTDLEVLSVGMVFDMLTEYRNDDYDYPQLASQEDFDRY